MRDTKDGITDRGIGIKHGNTFDLHPQVHWRCIIFAMMVVVGRHPWGNLTFVVLLLLQAASLATEVIH